jgi:hypothetical protein
MGMAPEAFGYEAGGAEAGVLGGGVGEAGLGFGAVEEAGAVGGFSMPLLPILLLGGVALIIILALALSKKK